jgi:hypothetical protein
MVTDWTYSKHTHLYSHLFVGAMASEPRPQGRHKTNAYIDTLLLAFYPALSYPQQSSLFYGRPPK